MKVISKDNNKFNNEIIDLVNIRINKHKRFVQNRDYIIHGTICLIAIVALIPSLQSLYTNLEQSGFFSFISVFFTDGQAIFAVLNDFVLAVAYSIPLSSIFFAGIIFVIFINSMRKLFTNPFRFNPQLS